MVARFRLYCRLIQSLIATSFSMLVLEVMEGYTAIDLPLQDSWRTTRLDAKE